MSQEFRHSLAGASSLALFKIAGMLSSEDDISRFGWDVVHSQVHPVAIGRP